MLEPERVSRALRELRSLTREVGANDPESFAELVAIRAEFDGLIKGAAAAQLRQGYSWGAIARALGVTRQSAHARYR